LCSLDKFILPVKVVTRNCLFSTWLMANILGKMACIFKLTIHLNSDIKCKMACFSCLSVKSFFALHWWRANWNAFSYTNCNYLHLANLLKKHHPDISFSLTRSRISFQQKWPNLTLVYLKFYLEHDHGTSFGRIYHFTLFWQNM